MTGFIAGLVIGLLWAALHHVVLVSAFQRRWYSPSLRLFKLTFDVFTFPAYSLNIISKFIRCIGPFSDDSGFQWNPEEEQ